MKRGNRGHTLKRKAYHSGTATGNNKSISIEICESGNREKNFRQYC